MLPTGAEDTVSEQFTHLLYIMYTS